MFSFFSEINPILKKSSKALYYPKLIAKLVTRYSSQFSSNRLKNKFSFKKKILKIFKANFSRPPRFSHNSKPSSKSFVIPLGEGTKKNISYTLECTKLF